MTVCVRQRGEDAWDFARSGAVHGLRSRVERELQVNLRARMSRLDVLQTDDRVVVAFVFGERRVRRAIGYAVS